MTMSPNSRRCSRMLSALAIATIAASVPATLAGQKAAPKAAPLEHLTQAQRVTAIQHAEVWAPTDVASMDLRAGPQGKGSYAPFATVPCDYVFMKPYGGSAKFECAVGPGDEVKVKYGKDNVEVYAEVAATRLMWALGFGSDAWYPVTVVCHGCPPDPFRDQSKRLDSVTFDIAAIERKMPGKVMETKPDEGWAWKALDSFDESAGTDLKAHRDALKLLAVFLQHTDSKPEQQRLICLPEAKAEDPSKTKTGEASKARAEDTSKTKAGEAPKTKAQDGEEACARPFMYIHDSGLTFGRANLLNSNQESGAVYARWAAVPVWKDPKRCVGKLSGSLTGTLTDPVISEAGRKFLADLLMQLTDSQVHDMFDAGRFGQRSTVTVDQWVDLFKKKRQEIVAARCPA